MPSAVVTYSANDYLKKQTSASRNKRHILELHNDTFVDVIFPLLDIRDIFRLRRTCKLLYSLSHQPIVWKRILQRFPLPLSPLPPTSRYSWENLSSLETERLIMRSLSLEANWLSRAPKTRTGWQVPAYYDVCSLKFAPGGRFLVASVRDAGVNNYALLLFVLDHRVMKCYPIAKYSCVSKAYHLEVKYMYIQGEHGLTIAYVRREPAGRTHREQGRNVSEFSDDHNIDFPIPVRYEVEVLRVSLETLEELCDPRFYPGTEAYRATAMEAQKPFQVIGRIRATEALEHVTLGEMGGQPFVAVARRPNQLIIKNLETGVQGKLTMLHCPGIPFIDDAYYKVNGIRILAHERKVLIVRTYVAPTLGHGCDSFLIIERFKVPLRGEIVTRDSHDRTYLASPRGFTHVSVSDHYVPSVHDLSALARPGPRAAAYVPVNEPGPISVHMATYTPAWTLGYTNIHPYRRLLSELETDASPLDPLPSSAPPAPSTVVEDKWISRPQATVVPAGPLPLPLEETGFEYPLAQVRLALNILGPEAQQSIHIISGSRRSLVYCTPINSRDVNPPITNLEAITDVCPWPAPDPRWPHDAARRQAAWEETKMATGIGRPFGGLAISPQAWQEMEHGVACIAWEEWSGRMVIVPKHTSHYMQVYDFACVPQEDANGHRTVPVPDVDNLYRLPESLQSNTSESDDCDCGMTGPSSGPFRLTTGSTIFQITGMDY